MKLGIKTPFALRGGNTESPLDDGERVEFAYPTDGWATGAVREAGWDCDLSVLPCGKVPKSAVPEARCRLRRKSALLVGGEG